MQENKLGKEWKFLRYFCWKERDIALSLLPSSFQKHRENESFLNREKKEIHWTVELQVKDKIKGDFWIVSKTQVSENAKIDSILHDFAKGVHFSEAFHSRIREIEE